MKILSLQGHFGNMNGQKIDFTDKLCCRVLPNGWGKTTVCAFIRVMLYGLNKTKRDTANALSDKTKYFPHDGKPMSGKMTVEFEGRRITIIRESNNAGPMQSFKAYYEDTGEVCTKITAQNCGNVLLGMSEDAFLSSVMVDGLDLMRPSTELHEMLISLAQTGDNYAKCSTALKTLSRWRLDINSGNGHGEQPRLEKAYEDGQKRLDMASELESQIIAQKEKVKSLNYKAQMMHDNYENLYHTETCKTVKEEGALETLKTDLEKRINSMKIDLPDEELLCAAEDALYGYEGAVSLEREKRKNMPFVDSKFHDAVRDMEEKRSEEEVRRNKITRPRIRWIAMCFAFLLALAAAGTSLVKTEWVDNNPSIPFILSGLAIVSLLVSFIGSVPRLEKQDNFDEAVEQLDIERRQTVDNQQMASSVLQDQYNEVIRAAAKIWPNVKTIEQAGEWIRASRHQWQSLKHEQGRLQDVLLELQQCKEEKSGSQHVQSSDKLLNDAKKQADDAKQIAYAAQQELFRLEGQLESVGKSEKIRIDCSKIKQNLDSVQQKYDAIQMAENILKEQNALLSSRISPKIAEYTKQYMAYLTNSQYSDVKLDDKMNAMCELEDGTMLDALRLSTGTKDQLYFALRLAVCQVLEDKQNVPIILDDPFITWDTKRTERGLRLLQSLSSERQIILFTSRQAGRLGGVQPVK